VSMELKTVSVEIKTVVGEWKIGVLRVKVRASEEETNEGEDLQLITAELAEIVIMSFRT